MVQALGQTRQSERICPKTRTTQGEVVRALGQTGAGGIICPKTRPSPPYVVRACGQMSVGGRAFVLVPVPQGADECVVRI